MVKIKLGLVCNFMFVHRFRLVYLEFLQILSWDDFNSKVFKGVFTCLEAVQALSTLLLLDQNVLRTHRTILDVTKHLDA